MKIGSIDLGHRPLFLAPMEDVSDPPFRVICKRYGADMLYTEFISSSGLMYEADQSLQKLDFYESERPLGIQIFGGDVDQVRAATHVVDEKEPDLIDINFGCPVKKVVCRDGGAGILRNLDKMQLIASEVVKAATRPVTVKTRLGWNDESIRILEVARRMEDVGIQALAVHARTRKQMYKGEARWEWLKKVKEESGIKIPFIGNGDAMSPERIKDMFDMTGVDGVMIGRGAIGNPWIFRDAKAYMETGEVPPRASWDERVSVATEHLQLKCEWLGEKKGVLEMRRMYGGYFKGFPGASRLRVQLMESTKMEQVIEVMNNFSESEAQTRKERPVAVAVSLKRPVLPA